MYSQFLNLTLEYAVGLYYLVECYLRIKDMLFSRRFINLFLWQESKIIVYFFPNLIFKESTEISGGSSMKPQVS